MERKEKAVKLFNQGYNCAQAVMLAFSDCLDIDEKTIQKITSSFGGGVSRLREVCGCVSAMAMVIGMIKGDYDVLDNDSKARLYKDVQELALKFKEKYGSYICSDLLNKEKGPENYVPGVRNETYYHNRSCDLYIAYMVEILQEKIKSYGKD